jgi:biopolymer transport protein ExbB/TolQ
MGIEHLLSHIARALKYPVLILAVAALVWVLIEVGRLLAEMFGRRRRSLRTVEEALPTIKAALTSGNRSAAIEMIDSVAVTPAMASVLESIVMQIGLPDADERIAKRLADYEYRQIRGLERTRILVRFGPALGLMGTLIPLSPALAGLAKGDVTTLSNNLQVAFSVTVTGLMIGALAFAISLVRDRLYGQDYSDVQYIASILTAPAS